MTAHRQPGTKGPRGALSRPIRVMLAEDHETVREGLRALFALVPDLDVVEEVGDTESALVRARAVALDVIVMDLSIPKRGGLEAIRALKAEHPRIGLVALTRHDDPSFVRAAFKAGASGYVLKQSSFKEVREAVARAARGERYIDSRLAGVLDDPQAGSEGRISARERDVLRRTARGESNKAIAEVLAISVRTVEAHKANGMRKLGIGDRSELVRYATVQGWLSQR